MSKVYFYWGVMESSKSLQLLATAHNYESQGKRVMCLKPERDDRSEEISTRAGLSRPADVVLSPDDNDIVGHVMRFNYMTLDCVLVDEVQFLSREQIIALTEVADTVGVPVICYGLLTDFQGHLFEGSKALIEYADKRQEVKTVCYYCNTKATMNLRLLGNMPVFDGEQVMIGDTKSDDEEFSYKPVCRKCFKKAQKHIIQFKK